MKIPGMAWLTAWVIMFVHVVTEVTGVQCYGCAYIPSTESDEACSDPWSWTRDKFNIFTGPPKHYCEEACVKTVIVKPGQWSTVLRTCGSPCNETHTGSTLTSCCLTDLCNSSTSWRASSSPSSRRWRLVYLLLLATLTCHWVYLSGDVR